MLDYGLVFRLLAGMPVDAPLIVQDAAEDDVARVRDFLLAQAEAAGCGGLRSARAAAVTAVPPARLEAARYARMPTPPRWHGFSVSWPRTGTARACTSARPAAARPGRRLRPALGVPGRHRRTAPHRARLRAHGATGYIGPDDAFSFDGLADDVVALLDRLGLTRPVVAVGVSMGAGVTLNLAIRIPNGWRRWP